MKASRVVRVSLAVIMLAIGAAAYGMGVPTWASVGGVAVGLLASFWLTRARGQSTSQTVPKA